MAQNKLGLWKQIFQDGKIDNQRGVLELNFSDGMFVIGNCFKCFYRDLWQCISRFLLRLKSFFVSDHLVQNIIFSFGIYEPILLQDSHDKRNKKALFIPMLTRLCPYCFPACWDSFC